MKTSIIHNDHTLRFKTWNQRELAPVIEYMAINILFKVVQRKQHLFIESTNDVGSLFCLPVVAVDTGFAYRCVAVRSYCFSLKAALVHINNGIALLLKPIKLTLILRSFYQTGFWMFQSLFFD